MRRSILAVVLALMASVASAEVCFNSTTGECVPNIFGTCEPGFVVQESCPPATLAYCLNEATGACGPASIFGGVCPSDMKAVAACPVVQPTPTVAPPVPTPVPTPEPGLLDRLKITLSSKLTLKLLGIFASMVVFIQAIKKILEKLESWEWLLNLIPQLKVVIAFLAHGIGPIILNVALTVALAMPAVLADSVVTLREVFAVIGLIVGNDIFYRAIRDWFGLFPKEG